MALKKIYIYSTNISPIMIINRIYEHQNLLSLFLVSFLVALRTYQHPCNKVLRKTCEPKWDEETGEAEWRKLLTNELRDLFSAPDITRVMKSIRIRWPGQGMQHVWGG